MYIIHRMTRYVNPYFIGKNLAENRKKRYNKKRFSGSIFTLPKGVTFMPEKQPRNLGIDLLRLLSMYGIVLLHVLGDSALGAPWMSRSYLAAWALETLALSAVNLFGLISGYVGVDAGNNPKRLLRLWLQVLFTSLVITVVMGLWRPDLVSLSPSTLLRACFPFTSGTYWYVTAYAGVLLFQPFLNGALEHTDGKTQRTFLFSVLLFFGVLPLLLNNNPYGLQNGYSMIWLIILYLLGGILRRQEIPARLGRARSALLFFGGAALALGGKLLVEALGFWRTGTPGNAGAYTAFPSPALVLAAIGGVCFFAATPAKGIPGKLTAFFAPAALGVYLWHVHPLTWYHVFSPLLPKMSSWGWRRLTVTALGCGALIFLLCLFLEKLRKLLFGTVQGVFRRKDEKSLAAK